MKKVFASFLILTTGLALFAQPAKQETKKENLPTTVAAPQNSGDKKEAAAPNPNAAKIIFKEEILI